MKLKVMLTRAILVIIKLSLDLNWTTTISLEGIKYNIVSVTTVIIHNYSKIVVAQKLFRAISLETVHYKQWHRKLCFPIRSIFIISYHHFIILSILFFHKRENDKVFKFSMGNSSCNKCRSKYFFFSVQGKFHIFAYQQ